MMVGIEWLRSVKTSVTTRNLWYWFYFFFFQAEDGIRDYKVTGVQTCALPISNRINDLPTPPPRQCWVCVPPVIALKTRGPRHRRQSEGQSDVPWSRP